MVDTSKFDLDTPIKISIMTPGYYIPELQTYTPLKSYASIEEVINIMNRGIAVEFPQQEKKEISEKIEDILLEYEEKKQSLKKKYGEVGSNIDKALETIQEINDSKVTLDEEIKEREDHIFDYSDVTNRVIRNLRDGFDSKILDALASPEDRIKTEEEKRKSRERVAARRKEALEMLSLETETLQKLSQGQYVFDDRYDNIEYDEQTTQIDKNLHNPLVKRK
jgi:chromosome segregation ATPase